MNPRRGVAGILEGPSLFHTRRSPGDPPLGARASRLPRPAAGNGRPSAGPRISTRAGCPRSRSVGLTLIEMLVVLVLVSLLGTLLLQGTGFLLGKYATVKRVSRDASLAALGQHWFISTVQAMVPSDIEARRFAGDAYSFAGVTLQALAAEPGLPVRARWSIEVDGASEAVVYAQEGGESWTVLTPADEGGLAFEYADLAGAWHDRWPVETDSRNPPPERIPRMIRLVSSAGRTVWLARADLFPEPVPNYSEDL